MYSTIYLDNRCNLAKTCLSLIDSSFISKLHPSNFTPIQILIDSHKIVFYFVTVFLPIILYKSKRTITVLLTIPSHDNHSLIRSLCKLTFHMINLLQNYRLSSSNFCISFYIVTDVSYATGCLTQRPDLV